MLKEKRIVLTKNPNNYSIFLNQLKSCFNDYDLITKFKTLIEKIEFSSHIEDTLFILFVEKELLKNISVYLNNNLKSFNYILIAYANENCPLISSFNNVFEYINLESTTFNFKFFCNKLSMEISNKNRIFLLQSEVKEFYEIGKSLSSEKDTMKLFEMIINSSINLTSSDAGTIYLVVDKETQKWSTISNNSYKNKLLKFVIAKNKSIDIHFETSLSPITKESIFGYTIVTGKSLRIDDAYKIDPGLDYKHNQSYDLSVDYITKSILSIPMKDHENNIMGVIQLINKKRNNDLKIDYTDKMSLENIIAYDYTDELIMNSLAGQAAVALENNLLYRDMKDLLEEYKKQNDQLALLSRKILKAHEEERRRIAREIHDGPAQSTANLSLKTDICKKFLQLNQYEKAYEEMDSLKKDIQSTVKEIRTIIYDLKPSFLEGGLISALENRLDIFRRSSDLNVILKVKGSDSNIEYYLTSTVYRIIQEALANVHKHADAKNVHIELNLNENNIAFAIKDDGKGFNIKAIKNKKYELKGGFGLEGIKERIELVKGKINIDSEVGKGTKLSVCIPLN